MDIPASHNVLSAPEQARLSHLLAVIPPTRRWEVGHLHGPLLCSLGLAEPLDDAYAHAARRFFGDPAVARRRALALLRELERDARAA